MQVSLRKLSDILGREHGQYRKLLELLSVQREAIVSHHPEDLNEILKYQGTIILELKALDEARAALMRKLARNLCIPGTEPTLSQIADCAEEPFATEYRSFAQQLRGVVQEVEKVHQDNSYLLDRSLDHVNGMLRLFTSAEVAGSGDYTRFIQHQPRVEQGRLLGEMA